MKNVYFVQPNNSLSGSLFLPYAVGSLAAYSFSQEEIKNTFRLCDFIFTKLPIEKALKQIENPFIIGFSCYMWNVEYNLLLAREIKQQYPNTVTVFGGPQIPNDTNFLEEYGYIDILIHGEGEIAFFEVLKSLKENTPLSKVSNISFRTNGDYIKTPMCPIDDLTDFPSPYSAGMFDGIVNNPEYCGTQFDAIIETNRGCPYKCIYCCWAGNKDTFRQFSDERIKGDLDWIAKNKIAYCICADSNFGILDRDEKIAEYIVSLKQQYGYPQKFETTAAKNKDDLIFRINQKLDSVNLNRGISVAVQSMSKDVLEIIGRKNMPADNLAEQLGRYRNAGMYTYTDIILGLPGETFESFCKGLFDVIEAGQHYSININRCEFLPNTLMYSDEYVEKYKIKTIKSYLCQNHSKVVKDLRFGSRSELVIETSTMSRQEWRKALRLSVCVQSFHCMGLLRFIAVYLRKSKGISYHDFYYGLFNRTENEGGFIKSKLDYVCASIETFLQGEGNLSFSNDVFGDIYWPFEEGLFLCCAHDADRFYSEIKDLISSYFDNECNVFSDLFEYQKSLLVLPNQSEKVFNIKYDWPQYFNNMFDPDFTVPKECSKTIKTAGNEIKTWAEYARCIVWYGKRDDKMINKGITTL